MDRFRYRERDRRRQYGAVEVFIPEQTGMGDGKRMEESVADISKLPRREFLKQAAGAIGAATQAGKWPVKDVAEPKNSVASAAVAKGSGFPEGVAYPRVFRGSQLRMISFPLGGVAAGSLGLGGRGQLRDWEIFNRPNQGFSPAYAFPAIWVRVGSAAPVAHVLESRLLPPYQGEDGLGWQNAPGLSRLKSATFTGEYPLAHVDFEDPGVPVNVSLDAFSPFIPHDPDDSGLPVAVLRYRVRNPKAVTAEVGICFSIDNPVANGNASHAKRVNAYRRRGPLFGLAMSNPGLPVDDPMNGSFVLAAIPDPGTRTTCWRGWPQGGWWNSPLLFWDTFSAEGQLITEPEVRNTVGAVCQFGSVPPGESRRFTFLLAWHFPNRTPQWCGWAASAGREKSIIGNFYARRFNDAWDAALYTAENLEQLETRTRQFARAFRESTIPDAIKEAASANLSTLASTTCFRAADGEFHGFEGSNDSIGCCYGNCTHVWSYETATAFLFPSFALSLRKAAFGHSEDDAGGIHARQLLPDGVDRDPIIAADGQMGQIMHAYLDWKLSGDQTWLESMWPRIQRAVSFAWVQGGWDPDRSGIAVGVQNNTYDVAFFGPNPLGGIYYLGALRAAEEMALAVGDRPSAGEYRKLFENGRQWIDTNLFNSEFYVQQIKGFPLDHIYPSLRIGATGMNPENPEYQLGAGCLVDQLMGQYLASVMNLGDLVSREHVRETLQSIYAYNYKRTLADHNSVQRTFALNDEAAMVICDYGKAARPRIPFPYFAEVMTGFEYSAATLMLYYGMVATGVECIRNIRARYDGEKRNPWDEAECGHHYARAMASWSGVVGISGFDFDGSRAAVVAVPRIPHDTFRCFWSTGSGWGIFSYARAGRGTKFMLQVLAGRLACQSCEISGSGQSTAAQSNGTRQPHAIETVAGRTIFRFNHPLTLTAGSALELQVQA
ncbi:MAG TPA: GH116 family glycosyl-hydrolase [Acidobacteriaceae bacterium]|nr:GH116 family glycosyl-hydrolase [Acidobacteriaceae bacterium]